ncbi:Purine nucleoside phosphorylase 1 [Pseudobythopirellula maris]|uniref:Purine nucleoside phosphorylase n=1 Tax=Pseudobythopirellula maris TaxID=2527991 RepID=A0A5C5ZSD8_9BACT|nr:purine-nucleoside phosphorylase [Pseudobythopirellula maris]TWT90419.1 Purine nucleoside phosphorylase 1 [Pseudobythopirellula maris]
MQGLRQQIEEVAAAVRQRTDLAPRVGIILGSGLGGLADEIEGATAIPYGELPHLPQSTAVGHAGRLVLGELDGMPVVAMQGRFHLYEGRSASQSAMMVYVMKALGVRTLVVTNAAGGINPQYRVGDPMLLDDHINLMFRNPLVGVNDDELGPRFPDMSAPYDVRLGEAALAAARRENFVCHRGVYAGMLGPTYETRAEYRMLRRLGADAAGMSTVPEAIAAQHAALPCVAISTITNECSPDKLGETSGDEVVHAADAASGKVRAMVRAVLAAVG